jgi:hAT family C-terminal dimerisation region/Domain of unknown function (DUF4413)
MQRKFSKYWETPNLILIIAIIFDHWYKLIFVRYCFQDVYGDEYETNLDIVRTWLTKYSEEYENFTLAKTINSEFSQSGMKFMGEKKLEMWFASKRFELDNYLEEPCMNIDEPNFNILQWWRKNSEICLILEKIARDFLAVQVSNIASETAFSVTDCLSDDIHNLMSEETIEALFCSK